MLSTSVQSVIAKCLVLDKVQTPFIYLLLTVLEAAERKIRAYSIMYVCVCVYNTYYLCIIYVAHIVSVYCTLILTDVMSVEMKGHL